jgi:hypothetical protein
MVHGEDVARIVLAVHRQPERAAGQRWMITDGRVYDWWDLASAWGIGPGASSGGEGEEGRGPHARWVRELMHKHGIRALPRPPEVLGRALDGREFWNTFELEPTRVRLEKD